MVHKSAFMGFLGGYREQGRSCLLISGSNYSVLIDAGIKKTYSGGRYGEVPYLDLANPQKLDAVLITHLHEDHFAMVPYLIKKGFAGPVYMTEETLELGIRYWRKWARIFEGDGRKLFSEDDVEEAIKHVRTVRFGDTVEVGDFAAKFKISGHAPGSAYLEVKAGERNILYLADIAKGTNVFKDSEPPEETTYDVIILNASYGDRVIDRDAMEKAISEEIADIVKRGGTALLPITAMGRGQETLAVLMKHRSVLGDAPILVEDTVLTGFNTLTKYTSTVRVNVLENLLGSLRRDGHVIVFKRGELRDIPLSGAVILASDLMLMGFSREVFMKIKDDPKSAVIITGYQAPGTFGRALMKAGDVGVFKFGDQVISFKCSIKVLPIKTHFDLAENVSLLTRLRAWGSAKLVLHHGEEPNTFRLAHALTRYTNVENIVMPSVPSFMYLV